MSVELLTQQERDEIDMEAIVARRNDPNTTLDQRLADLDHQFAICLRSLDRVIAAMSIYVGSRS